MQISAYPPTGSNSGLSVLDIELVTVLGRQRGQTFYVDSNATGDATGLNWDDAVVTLDAAINKCAADDRIIMSASHSESIAAAAGIAVDVAGLTIIGLGQAQQRSRIAFITDVGADMDIDAAGVTLVNVDLRGGVDALTGPIDINGDDFTGIDLGTADVTGQATDFITVDADRCTLIRPTHRGAIVAGAQTWLVSTATCDRLVIEDPVIDGDFAAACIEDVTNANTLMKVYGGASRPALLRTRNSADIIVTCVSTTTVDVGPNLFCRVADDAAGTLAEMTVAADGQFWDPIEMVNADGESSIGTDITASTDA